MNINLFTNYYNHHNDERQKEIDFCRDINNKLKFNFITCYYGDELPTYYDLFSKLNCYPNDINIISNSDIFFTQESLDQINEYFTGLNEEEKRNTCMSLTRWEYLDENNSLQPKAQDSQDTWIFFGGVRYDEAITDVTLGTPGCDNRIVAELMYRYKYKLINPSLTIKTYHYHASGDSTRTYFDESMNRTRMVQGPYEFLPPHELDSKVEETMNINLNDLRILIREEIESALSQKMTNGYQYNNTELPIENHNNENEKLTEINFIITCFDKESYSPYLIDILNSYKKIKANYVICYNGTDENFKCDFRCEYKPNGGRGDDGHPHGCPYADSDCELTIGGYELLKNNGVNKWVKLSIDSWLVDEDKIIQIFNELESTNSAYAGNYWYQRRNLTTDIFFANTNQNNIFEDLKLNFITFFDYMYETKNPEGLELYMGCLTNVYDKLIIVDREPLDASTTRWQVPKLGWTMSHVLETNIEFCKNYVPNNDKMLFTKVEGSNIPFILEDNKKYI